jgi:uncharacterized protein (DUF885 family)
MVLTKKVIAKFCALILLFSLQLNVSANPMAKQLSLIVNDYESKLLEYSPESGLFWGNTSVALDRFTDYSLEAYTAWQQQEDEFLSALSAIDEKELQDRQQYNIFRLLKGTLENKKASRICREELWDVNPADGWHIKMAIVAEKQPVGTAKYRQLALKRWQTFEKVVDNQINNLKIGQSLGYTAPKPAIERVLTQLKVILNSTVEESPFFDFAKRDGDQPFKMQVAKLIKTVINPSIKKYSDYLENEYLPLVRDEVGVWSLPSGAQCYQAKIQEITTLSITPQEIHNFGLQYIQKLDNEVAKIGLKKYGTKDMAVIFQRAKKDSMNFFSSEQDILNYNFRALARMKAKVTDWFDIMPKAKCTIKPYPAHRAKTGASGEYHPPSEDGKVPGIFYINTYDPKKRSRIDLEATLFHELIPGHHFQIALLLENKAIPSLNKYLWNSGYGEGWALYVERLADEMGMYKDDISRLGMLSNETLRAARLVVDTGIHAKQWSRERAVEYLTQHTALNKDIIEGEVDRYIMLPAQATAYMLGKREIESLRQIAKERLGHRFDIREFHNQILKNGAVSLPMLRAQIMEWLDNQKE